MQRRAIHLLGFNLYTTLNSRQKHPDYGDKTVVLVFLD